MNYNEKIAELREQLTSKTDRADELTKLTVGEEKRSLTDDEKEETRALQTEISEIKEEIENYTNKLAEEARNNSSKITKETNTSMKNFHEEIRSMQSGQTIELRGVGLLKDNEGAGLAPEKWTDIVDILFNNTVLDKMGVSFMDATGNGTVKIPYITTIPKGKKRGTPNEAAVPGKFEESTKVIQPDDFVIQAEIPNALFTNTITNQAELISLLSKELDQELNQYVVDAIDAHLSGVAAQVTGKTLAEVTRKDIINLRRIVERSNISSTDGKFLMNTDIACSLEATSATNETYVYNEGGKLMGRDVVISNIFPTEADGADFVAPIYFGAWNEVVVPRFGNPTLHIDRDSKEMAGKNMTAVTINVPLGIGFKRDSAIAQFEKAKMIF